MSQKHKFDTFYFIDDDCIHPLSDISSIDNDVYIKKYKEKIYCPECKKVQLSLTHKANSVYLRSYPNQEHENDSDFQCSYFFESANTKEVKEYVTNLKDIDVQSKLKSTMRWLSSKGLITKKSQPSDSKNIDIDDTLIVLPNKVRKMNRKIIPRYSFCSVRDNVPLEQIVLLYGLVYISKHQRKRIKDSKEKNYPLQTTFFSYNISRQKDTKVLCSFTSNDPLIENDGFYNVVAIGTVVRKPNSQHEKSFFYNLKVNKNHILMESA